MTQMQQMRADLNKPARVCACGQPFIGYGVKCDSCKTVEMLARAAEDARSEEIARERERKARAVNNARQRREWKESDSAPVKSKDEIVAELFDDERASVGV